MTQETPTIEAVKADLKAKLDAEKARLQSFEAAVKAAEKAMSDVAVAHAKEPNVLALTDASTKLVEASDRLARARASARRFENKLTDLDEQAQREADGATALALCKKADAMVAPTLTTPVSRGWLKVSGAIPVSDLKPSDAESEMVKRWDIHQVTVATVEGDDGKPCLSCSFFPKRQKRASTGGGGGGGGRFVNVSPDGSMRLTDKELLALLGPEHIGDEKTQHALTATGGTLYVTARSLRDKAGWTREQK